MIDRNEMQEENIPELPIPDNTNIGDPVFCTQQSNLPRGAECVEFVAESPNPMFVPNVAKPMTETIVGKSLGAGVDAVGTTIHETVDTDVHTLDGTGTVGDTGGTNLNELSGFEGENGDEAWSKPKEPYLGMRFDTMEGAKQHYNGYALQLGFSIQIDTSRRSSDTHQLIKQQFVCNKFRKPKEADGGVEIIPA
ncbi:Protein FAR-RED ELONGATED HYPOCOTYL 3 [Hordeum vulgare]|nr:Protein FAR-RED ELONGATED HYPOCOTYL 3 [Hordeum vulgare]